MFIGNKGIDIIKEFEGCILRSYDDYNDKVISAGESYSGTLTIGYGHTEGVFAGQEITQQQADDLLISDMSKYCNQVQEVINEGIITFPVNQNMFDALVSFDYNLGQGCLKTLCQNRSKEEVAEKMLLYINPGSVWAVGLLRRRTAERELFLSDETSTPISVPTPISTNSDVVELQHNLNVLLKTGLVEDGDYGPKTTATVRQFQSIMGLTEDGDAGTNTKGAITAILTRPTDGVPYPHMEYPTRYIQFRVGVNTDGIFGNGTKGNVVNWQENHGLSADGVVGPATWSKLLDENV